MTIAGFIVLLILCLANTVKYPGSVRAEFAHPVKLNFFATISIGLIFLSIALLSDSAGVSLTALLTKWEPPLQSIA
ncbi:MAG: hypothetical protein KGY54_13505 [Oleiphilaceae bacterium]|nr:hypothetical protein [Oleiphilaceae bacterium]